MFNLSTGVWKRHTVQIPCLCFLTDDTRAMRGNVWHTLNKLKDIPFLALIILSEKISSAPPALTPNISYSNFIFQVINSISQHSTVFYSLLIFLIGIDSVRQLLSPCLQFYLHFIQFYSEAFKIFTIYSLSSILLISVMSVVNEVWQCTTTEIHRLKTMKTVRKTR